MTLADPSGGPFTLRFWRDLSIALAATSLVGFGGLYSMLVLFNDCSELQTLRRWETLMSALEVQEAAIAAGGRFPENSEYRQPGFASGTARALDPWGRPLRYEQLDQDGKRARIFSLGVDDRPGGCGCDEDIVWWIDVSDEYVTCDAREEPAAWGVADGIDSPGRR